MRCSRQSGQGARPRPYWKNHAPRIVAAPPAATIAAAVTIGSVLVSKPLLASMMQAAAEVTLALAALYPVGGLLWRNWVTPRIKKRFVLSLSPLGGFPVGAGNNVDHPG